jgi:phosphatidylglycerol---prolipoprotein diacylglyceryl transferase
MGWHFLFESIAYAAAFRFYVREREKVGDFLDLSVRWSVIVAAVVGAVIGSKLLYWLEDPSLTLRHWTDLGYMMGGKTIVGALLGGTMGVELMKWRAGITRRTGDLFALPLCIGIAIGRIGCFLAGKQDDTYGIPTSLPWGVDLGDGVRRHPVQIYEILAMIVLAGIMDRIRGREGDRFRVFALGYFSWRILVDFLKPGVRWGGLTAIQWACAGAVVCYAPDLWRMAVGQAPGEEASHG